MKVVADHRPENLARRPTIAPIRQHLALQAGVVKTYKVTDEQGVAGFELFDRGSGGMRGIDLREGQLRRTKRVLVIHHFALGYVYQTPSDRRERRWIGMRRLGVIDGPPTIGAATDGPAPRYRFPEELIVAEALDTCAKGFVRLLQLLAQELRRTSPRPQRYLRPMFLANC